MIANAIYLQIENDNNASLKNLNCYLDSPFLLCVLGYKTEEENESAKELYDLLIKYNATLRCFEHTFNEIINILNYYKKNINKTKVMTLEYFDKEKYTEGQVELVITSLEDRLKELHINIIETPEYKESRYAYVINEEQLEEKLTKHKEKLGNYFSANAIENDVKSVYSINMLRAGKNF